MEDPMFVWICILTISCGAVLAMYGAAVAVAWVLARVSKRGARVWKVLTDNF